MLGKFVRMPGWVHNSDHVGIREPWGNQQAPTYCLLPTSVEILGKVTFSCPSEKEGWGFLGLPVEAEWGPPACVPLPWAAGPSAGSEGGP